MDAATIFTIAVAVLMGPIIRNGVAVIAGARPGS